MWRRVNWWKSWLMMAFRSVEASFLWGFIYVFSITIAFEKSNFFYNHKLLNQMLQVVFCENWNINMKRNMGMYFNLDVKKMIWTTPYRVVMPRSDDARSNWSIHDKCKNWCFVWSKRIGTWNTCYMDQMPTISSP